MIKKVLLISLITIIQLGLIGSVGYLGYSNYKINKKIKDFDANFYVYAAKIDSIDSKQNLNDYYYDIKKLKNEVQSLRWDVNYLMSEDNSSKLKKIFK